MDGLGARRGYEVVELRWCLVAGCLGLRLGADVEGEVEEDLKQGLRSMVRHIAAMMARRMTDVIWLSA